MASWELCFKPKSALLRFIGGAIYIVFFLLSLFALVAIPAIVYPLALQSGTVNGMEFVFATMWLLFLSFDIWFGWGVLEMLLRVPKSVKLAAEDLECRTILRHCRLQWSQVDEIVAWKNPLWKGPYENIIFPVIKLKNKKGYFSKITFAAEYAYVAFDASGVRIQGKISLYEELVKRWRAASEEKII